MALLVMAGEMGFPTGIPIEIALLLTGAYAIHSWPALLLAVIGVAAADLTGTTALHLTIRTGGVRLLDRLLRKHHEKQQAVLNRWRARVGGRDSLVIFVVRLLPLVRMYASIGAGILRIEFRSFIAGAAPAALLWSGTPLVVGYLVRADAARLESRYAAGSHVALAALPVVSLLAGGVFWVRQARPETSLVLRGRSIIGAVAATVLALYVDRFVWTNRWSIEHGSAGLPRQMLVLWLGALCLLIAVLVAYAMVDLRLAATVKRGSESAIPRLLAGATGTALWLAVVTAAGSLPLALELRYPAL